MSDPRLDALERLAVLRDAGTLSADEYEAEKARVLRGEGLGKPWGRYAAIAAGVIALVAGGGWAVQQAVGPVVDQTAATPTASAEASDAAVAITPSPSADPYAGAELTSCRQGECYWEKVLSTDTLRTTPDGTVKVLRTWEGTSRHMDGAMPAAWRADIPIEWGTQVVETYVFCSTSFPGIAFQDRWEGGDGRWIGHRLDLYDVSGFQTDSARTYLKVCHKLDLFGPGMPDRLRKLGYEPGTMSGQSDLASPLDIAKPVEVAE